MRVQLSQEKASNEVMMRRLVGICAVFAVAAASGVAVAQTHVVKKPETVVRAIGVFEWTGDEAKPTASRLVPVSVFIDSQLEDAGIYMARPVPFALYTGTIFEVQKSGIPEGTVQLAYERHLEGNSVTQFDDGWLGYGLFKPASQGPVYASRKGGPLPQVVASGGNRPKLGNKTDSGTAAATADDSSRPTMRRRTGSDSTDTAASGDSGSTPATTTTASNDDSSRPTMRRRTDSTASDSTSSTDSTPDKTSTTQPTTTTASDDPDRPVLKRRADSTDTPDAAADDSAATPAPASSTSDSSKTASSDDSNRPTMRRRTPDSTDSASTTIDSTDDTDRPTLKKRTPQQQGKSQKRQGDTASVSSVGGSLNDDPDRPTLHRGSGSDSPDGGIPPLNGLPADMHQRVAVSDAKDRPEHDFARPWDSDSERADVLAKMQEFARARLAKYDVPAPAQPAPVPAASTQKTTAKAKKPAPPPPPPTPVALSDESLRGYTLSYGGSATFVYSASSPGIGGATRYVSIVAQRELMGEPKVALSSVTDTTHLDRTPWMRLVDVVDAEASNRASLLFELRGQSARQFALYRVIGSTAEQIFQTGTTE